MEKLIEGFKENYPRYIKTIIMDAVVVLVSLAYIFHQMLSLEPAEINPLVLISNAFIGIVCGVMIKQALGENGFSKGYNSDIWKREEKKYNDACNSANPYMDRVENFYLYEEIEKKKNYRRQHLQAVRLKYNMWFDKDHDYIGTKEMFNKLDYRQKRVVRKCIRVKIYVLNLFSQYATVVDQDTRKEITDKTQRNKNITKNTLTATFIATIGVYFVPVLYNWSWTSLINSTMQVALWVLFGVLQLYTNYTFVVQDRVSIMRKKKETIKRFTTNCDKGLFVKSPYDKEETKTTLTPTT